MSDLKTQSLNYHAFPIPGKLKIISSKPCNSQQDLSLAYTPGVAFPALEIKKDPDKSYVFTGRANTVGVITNGTAVLGLGNIGPLASLPVMEGKCVLLQRFAAINGIPIAINVTNTKEFINVIRSLEVNFGAVNLEDIKAPECFEIEKQLIDKLKIPVFHDDQHGTAVIVLAAIYNSLKLVGKIISQVKIVINGAGSAGIACAKLLTVAGVPKNNLTMLDKLGVIYPGRKEDMNNYKKFFAQKTVKRSLKEALSGADIFLGVSVANVLSGELIKKMNKDPIVFALANPDPEILPEEAKKYGAKIVATGRSDFPNQVNNVLGFPGIFRAVLDTRSKVVNNNMKLATAKALSELAREKIPQKVLKYLSQAYPTDYQNGMFDGKNPLKDNYILPKPLDPRVVPRVAKFVIKEAMKSKVAGKKINNPDDYEKSVYDLVEKQNVFR